MSGLDQKVYLMTEKKKEEIKKEFLEEYDTDLEKTMYQEFWTELKPKDKDLIKNRGSKSVLHPGGGSQNF